MQHTTSSFHNSGQNGAELKPLLGDFKLALREEIAAVRTNGSQKTYISDGRRLGRRDNAYIYSFTADSELRFPDDTPVDLEYQDKKHEGVLLSIDGFDLVIALQADIGEAIVTAILHTEPWFLLEQLHERLDALQRNPDANTKLASRLISSTTQVQEPVLTIADPLLESIPRTHNMPLNYNDDQRRAIAHVLTNDVSFIWGPPGTGKTTTLGLTVAALVAAGQSVLVVAHSNAAVDVAMGGVARNLAASDSYSKGKIIRFGFTNAPELDQFPFIHVRGIARQQHPKLIAAIEELERQARRLIKQSRQKELTPNDRQRIKDQIAEIKQKREPLRQELKRIESELVRQATVVGCTLSKASIAPEIFERQFDAVVIDEASMAYIPHCVYVASLAKQRVAIFGDFRQLAPIAQAETLLADRWLKRDIFAQAGITERVNRNKPDSRLVLLATQHRMHPAISHVVNTLFYNKRLRDGAGVAERAAATVQAAPCPKKPLVLFDLSDALAHSFSDKESGSRFNPVSALCALELAKQAIDASAQNVGIVTPYNAQSRLIRRLLKDLDLPDNQIRVATVHRFQGSECNTIIFDAVDSEPQRSPGLLLKGGMDSTAMRLANVAVSRAQGKFIGLFNKSYLCSHLSMGDSVRDLVTHLTGCASLQTPTWLKQSQTNEVLPRVVYYPNSKAATIQIERDLRSSAKEIAISWPSRLSPLHFSARVLTECNPSNVRFIIAGSGSSAFDIGLKNALLWEGQVTLSVGIVGVDRKSLWIYLKPDDINSPVLHLSLPKTIDLLYAFWRLIPEEKLGQRGSLGLPCPQCKSPLWIATGKYGAYLSCTGGCGYTRSIKPGDATEIALLNGITCGRCGGAVRGRKADNVFLACVNYPECRWTMPVESII